MPLISPLLDIIDDRKLAYSLEFYHDYYTFAGTFTPPPPPNPFFILINCTKIENNVSNYSYPFLDSTEFDYLDFQQLSDSGIIFCLDWDTPVFATLLERNETVS